MDEDVKHNSKWQRVRSFFSENRIWAGLGLIAAIAAAYFAWVQWTQMPTYALQVVTLTRSSLVDSTGMTLPDLQILYQGEPIKNLVLVDVKLENTGNQPVKSAEYESSLDFVFPDKTEVLSAETLETRPLTIKPKMSATDNRAQLQPLLLNPTDRMTFRFMVNDPTNSFSRTNYIVDARIANITDIIPIDAVDTISKRANDPRSASDQNTLLLYIVVLGAMIALYGFTNFTLQRRDNDTRRRIEIYRADAEVQVMHMRATDEILPLSDPTEYGPASPARKKPKS